MTANVQRRRVAQEKERVAHEQSLKQKVTAAAFAREHLGLLMDSVFDTLVTDGHFYDPLTREVRWFTLFVHGVAELGQQLPFCAMTCRSK